MDAFGLPKKYGRGEQEARKAAIEAGHPACHQVPFEVMKVAFTGFEVAEAMAATGNPNSVSDAGVGALALQACIEGCLAECEDQCGRFEGSSQGEQILRGGCRAHGKGNPQTSNTGYLKLVEGKH